MVSSSTSSATSRADKSPRKRNPTKLSSPAASTSSAAATQKKNTTTTTNAPPTTSLTPYALPGPRHFTRYTFVRRLLCAGTQSIWSPMATLALVMIIGIPCGAQYAGAKLGVLTRVWAVVLRLSPLVPLYYFFRSIYISPAVKQKSWDKYFEKNPNAKAQMRFCDKCNYYKPYRASHCSICNTCTIRRDHHCPWVNNCVSFFNHYYFILFLFTTTLALLVNVFFLYQTYKAFSISQYVSNKSSESGFLIAVIMMCGSMGFSMLFAIPMILAQQIKVVLTNQAGCEEYDFEVLNRWLKIKKQPQMPNIYNVGIKENITQILFPRRYDGISFPTIKNYTDASYARTGKAIDKHAVDLTTQSTNVAITAREYDGSLFIEGDFWSSFLYPFFGTVLPFKQGEVLYLSDKAKSSGWIKCCRIVSDGANSESVQKGKVPAKYLKYPD